MRPSRLALVALCCLAGLASVAVVASAPPPTQLCGSCGSGIPGATGAGTLDIYVDGDGDSEWVERVPVNESVADRYREDPSALEGAVDDAWNDSYYLLVERSGEAVDRTARLENGTITVTYAVDDVARPGVRDAWLIDYFVLEPANHRYGLRADRVTIHTPEETVVTNRPQYATVTDNTATWTAPIDFSDRTYVTYGASDSHGVLNTASSHATIGLEIGPATLGNGVLVGSVPGLVLGLAGLAVGRVDWGRDAFETGTLERLLIAVGAVGTGGLLVISIAVPLPDRLFAPGPLALSTLGVGYAVVGLVGRRRGTETSVFELTGLVALTTIATGTLMTVLAGLPSFVGALPLGLAAALFLPIGYAFEREGTPTALLFAVVLAPVVTAVVSTFAYTLPWVAVAAVIGYPLTLVGGLFVGNTLGRGSTLVGLLLVAALVLIGASAGRPLLGENWFGLILYWLLFSLGAIVVAVFGYPLALLGRRLASDGLS